MLNWIFLKKLLFTATISSSTAIPVYLIYKNQQSRYSSEVISEFKKHIKDFPTGSYTDNINLSKFAKYLLKNEELEEEISPVIVKELLFEWFKNKNPKKYQELLKEEEENFKNELQGETIRSTTNINQRVFDRHGGTRDIMRKRYLSEKIYEKLKDELLSISETNFTVNTKKGGTNNLNEHFISKDYFLTESEINNKSNWSQISWYPIFTDELKNNTLLQEYEKEKFNFINYAYKLWYLEYQPFVMHAALWKYDEQSKKLEEFYSKENLKDDFPSKPNYSFPVFSDETEGKEISKLEKFKQFVNLYTQNGESKGLDNDVFYLPLNLSDDNSTMIYVEGKNMYEKLYTEFAAASNYMYEKVIYGEGNGKESETNNCTLLTDKNQEQSKPRRKRESPTPKAAKTSKLINPIKKDDLKSKNLNDLFVEKLESENGENSSEVKEVYRRIQIDSQISKKNEEETKKVSYDIRELESNNWMFIRNKAGIHAMKIDGVEYINKNGNGEDEGNNNQCKLKKAYDFFNFRMLQSSNKEKLNINKTFKQLGEQQLDSFKEFIKNEFEYIITKYWSNNSEQQKNKNIFAGIKLEEEEKLKKLLENIQKIIKYKEKIKKINLLRQKIIDKYASRKYVLITEEKNKKTLKNSDKSEGISGTFPYLVDISLENQKLFPELEKIYDHDQELLINNSKESEKENGNKKIFEELEKMYKEYYKEVDEYISKLSLSINNQYSFMHSDRLFTNSYLVDQWTEIFLQKPDAVNKYIITDYLINHVLKEQVNVDATEVTKKFKNEEGETFISLIEEKQEKEAKRKKREADQTKTNEWFKTGKDSETFKNFSELLRRYYYKKEYIPKENFWDVLKYGKWKNNEEEQKEEKENNNKNQKQIQPKIEENFKNKYFLNFDKNRQKYQNFLITLFYLTNNNFEKFIEIIQKNVKNSGTSYLVWEKSESTKDFDFKNIFNNPWMKSEYKKPEKKVEGAQNQGKKEEEKDDENKYEESGHLGELEWIFSSQHKKTENSKSEEAQEPQNEDKYIFKDLVVTNQGFSGFWNNWIKLEKLPEKALKYSNRQELIDIVNKIRDSDELEAILSHLEKNISTTPNFSSINNREIYIELNGNKEGEKKNKILKSITFEDKKNALSAFVNNYKMPRKEKLITGINASKYKQIYLKDPENNYSPTGSKHKLQTTTESKSNNSYEENIKDNDFSRFMNFINTKNEQKNDEKIEKQQENNKKYFLIQLKDGDLNNLESFKNFLNECINEDIFWEWLFNTATREDIQTIAMNDIDQKIQKMYVFDSEWKNNIKGKYLKN